MNLLKTLFSQEVTQALGWTLLHSLWQGLLVAVVLAFVLVLLRRHSSQLRYVVSVLALGVVVAASAVTFWQQYEASVTRTGSTFVVQAAIYPDKATAHATATEETSSTLNSYAATFIQYLQQNHPIIVLLWLLGISIMLLRLLGGVVYVQRLKHYQTKPVNSFWRQKLQDLRRELRISQAVRMVESAMVQTPMVVGYLKPVVLLPLGTLAGLPATQVEAILAHELAHIARKDYLVNLFQSVVEVVLFYHPAIWWINNCIRTERENCCDDQAVALCGDTLSFAHALANLEEIRLQAPQLAMAFAGNKYSLLKRISRLVNKPETSRTDYILPVVLLAISLLGVSVSAVASFSTRHTSNNKITPATEATTRNLLPLNIPDNFNYDHFYYTLADSSGKDQQVVIVK
ncbi:MAG: M56 family metallopeptidase, partial [Hymenobacteraceae bacterium]|nr:M56 family metallopeptidase [Hymenobacteraceae bacterium]